MTFPPPTPGPFGPGGGGSSPPPFGGPPSPFGGVVVHRARLLPRLLLVGVFTLLPLVVTVAIVWFSFDGAGRRDGPTRVTERGADAEIVGGGGGEVALPTGWPEALTPPEGARVVSSVASGGGTPEESLVMVVEVRGEGPAVARALEEQLAAAGLAVTTDAVGPDGTGALTAAGAGWEASVTLAPTPARPAAITVSWVLRAGPR